MSSMVAFLLDSPGGAGGNEKGRAGAAWIANVPGPSLTEC